MSLGGDGQKCAKEFWFKLERMKEIKLETKVSSWKRILLKYFKMVREGEIASYLSGEKAGRRFFCQNTGGNFSCIKFGVDDCGARARTFLPLTPQI
jgi:hypothetical protein